MKKIVISTFLLLISSESLAVSRDFDYESDFEHAMNTKKIREENRTMADLADAIHQGKKEQQRKFKEMGKFVRDDSNYGNVLERKIYEAVNSNKINKNQAFHLRSRVLKIYQEYNKNQNLFNNTFTKVINPRDSIPIEKLSNNYEYLNRNTLDSDMIFYDKDINRKWICKTDNFIGYLYQDDTFIKEFIDHPLCIFYNTTGKARIARDLNPLDDPEEYAAEKEKERKQEEYETILRERVQYMDSQYYIDAEKDQDMDISEYTSNLAFTRKYIFDLEYQYKDCIEGYYKPLGRDSCDDILSEISSEKKKLDDEIEKSINKKIEKEKEKKKFEEEKKIKELEEKRIEDYRNKKREYNAIISKRQKEFDKIKDRYREQDGKENIFSKTQFDEKLYDLRKKLFYDSFLYQDCLDGYLDDTNECDTYKIDKVDIEKQIESILNSYRK